MQEKVFIFLLYTTNKGLLLCLNVYLQIHRLSQVRRAQVGGMCFENTSCICILNFLNTKVFRSLYFFHLKFHAFLTKIHFQCILRNPLVFFLPFYLSTAVRENDLFFPEGTDSPVNLTSPILHLKISVQYYCTNSVYEFYF